MSSRKSASPRAAVHEVTLRKYLGRALRDHRRQHALTISQVAELARISSGMLSKIENGQVAPTLDVIEQAYITWVLTSEGGNKTRAAEVLGIDPSTLYRKLSRYEGGDKPGTEA